MESIVIINTMNLLVIRDFHTSQILFRYGFITFNKRETVDKVFARGRLYFQGKRLNLGPAVRKQVRVRAMLLAF